MKVLFHVCCGPCAIEPIRTLIEEGNEVTGFFYNPNIQPYSEMVRRLDAVRGLFLNRKWTLIEHNYDMNRYFTVMDGSYDAGNRCRKCWHMRLLETAAFAARNGFDAFTTTLLISPYQDYEAIGKIGNDIVSDTGVEFLFRDFRELFRGSQKIAREEGLYMQKYCGCLFSERERFDKSFNKD